jgi:Rrf2 family protein
MTVLFSKRAEIAIQSMLLLATKNSDEGADARSISEELRAPKMFCAKILQQLKYAGFLTSKKGKNGGFYLIDNGDRITILQIIEAIDGRYVFENCVLGFRYCSDEHPCPAHPRLAVLRKDIYDMMRTLSIGDLQEVSLNKIKYVQSLMKI